MSKFRLLCYTPFNNIRVPCHFVMHDSEVKTLHLLTWARWITVDFLPMTKRKTLVIMLHQKRRIKRKHIHPTYIVNNCKMI